MVTRNEQANCLIVSRCHEIWRYGPEKNELLAVDSYLYKYAYAKFPPRYDHKGSFWITNNYGKIHQNSLPLLWLYWRLGASINHWCPRSVTRKKATDWNSVWLRIAPCPNNNAAFVWSVVPQLLVATCGAANNDKVGIRFFFLRYGTKQGSYVGSRYW